MLNNTTKGKGTLYVVATPIGNLSDITLRAIDTLRSVDLILSEDTRQTKKLLNKYQITSILRSYRDQNHEGIVSSIEELLNLGKNIALVSDSGTPLISDPGYKLVRDLKKKEFNIIPIPGPSALVSALSASGLPTDRFIYLGFLPKSSGKRCDLLKQYGDFDATLVIYESPHRVIKLLEEILDTLGNRQVCLASEITKMFENLETGDVESLLSKHRNARQRGEYTVLVSKMLY